MNTAHYPISLILLASGASSRMKASLGKDKMQLTLSDDERTLLQTTLEIYRSCPFAEILVIVRQYGREEPTGKTQFIVNENAEQGMASSLVLGVKSASPNVSGYLIALADMPLVQIASIEALCNEFLLRGSQEAICVPTFRGQRGNPVLFGSAYKDELLRLIGDVGAKSLLRQYATRVREVETDDEGILLDIDTAQDWQHFLQKKAAEIAK